MRLGHVNPKRASVHPRNGESQSVRSTRNRPYLPAACPGGFGAPGGVGHPGAPGAPGAPRPETPSGSVSPQFSHAAEDRGLRCPHFGHFLPGSTAGGLKHIASSFHSFAEFDREQPPPSTYVHLYLPIREMAAKLNIARNSTTSIAAKMSWRYVPNAS